MCDDMREGPGMREVDQSPEEAREQNQLEQGQDQREIEQPNQECNRDQRPTNFDGEQRDQFSKMCCAKLIAYIL